MSQKQRIEELRKKRKKQRESLMSFFKRFQDRLSRFQKMDEPTKSETVGDAQKMRTRTKTSMADAQKMRTRTKTDMADTQKMRTQPKSAMSTFQKQGQISKGVKTVSDDRKKFQTYKDRDEVAKMFDRARRKAGSSNKTTVKDAQKRGQTDPYDIAKTKEPKTFKEAFKRARQEGKSKFTYKGKSYAAVTMDEVKKAKKQGKIEKATLAAYLNMKRKKK